MKAEELKHIVKEKYTEIANNSLIENNSGCCGIPMQFALLNEGDVELDLGSGAGNGIFSITILAYK